MSHTQLNALLAWTLLTTIAAAQTVQLPTFHQFGVSTTVVVPDRGSVHLGGVKRGKSGSSQFGAPGLPGNRASGAAAETGGVSVSAQIHDFEAMDKALLEQAAAGRSPRQSGRESVSRRELQAPRGNSAKPNPYPIDLTPSLAEIQRQKAAKPPIADDAEALLAQATSARDAGKLGTARVYAQMAVRRAAGPLREQALAMYHSCKVDRNSRSR